MRPHRQILVAILTVAAAPVARAQSADSTAYTRRPEIRFALMSDGITRAMAVETSPSFKRSTRLNGVEFLARSTKSGGVQLRYVKGDLGGPTSDASSGPLEYVDGRVFIGPRKFAVALGYLGRSQNFNQAKRRFDLARGGLNMTYHFDGAGVGFNFAGSYLRTVTKTKADSLEAEGFEGETGVLYAVPKLPVFLQLGYRRELFRIFKESDTIRREEVSGVLLSLGLQYGLSTR
jgi:hypothetical protein